MTEAIWIAIIAAMPGVAMTLGTIFQVRRVHVLVNSQKDALTRLLRQALATVQEMEDREKDYSAIIADLRKRLDHSRQEEKILDQCPLLHANTDEVD